MSVIGLFEAKTKFSEICERVVARGRGITITRRGKPFVKIEPIHDASSGLDSVWDRRAQHEKRHGRLKDDLVLPPREKQRWRDPLAD